MGKAKGKMKEAAGALSNNEDKRTEGQAQQRKDAAEEGLSHQPRHPPSSTPDPEGTQFGVYARVAIGLATP